jgi:ParB family chromosome partitioning protein
VNWRKNLLAETYSTNHYIASIYNGGNMNRALGKGLSALIPERQDRPTTEGSIMVKTASIRLNTLQPRSNYADDKLEELKLSIKEKGILQPLLIREKDGGYEVIAGERRLRAATALNLETVPAVIRNVNDEEALVLALIENLQREELNPIEEAEAYKKLIESFNYTHDTLAQSIGKDRSTITNLLRLLKLPKELRESLYKGEMTVGHARALLAVESPTEKMRLADLIVKEGISVRELERLISGDDKGVQPTKKNKDFEISSLEEELQKILGTKVTIQHKKKKGKIILEYYSLEDFDRILGFFKK